MKYLEVVGKEKKSFIVQSEIKRLYDLNKKITPQMLVEAAEDVTNVLHSCFEWDDTVAAEKYRIGQATQMILAQRFVIELREKNQPITHEPHAVRSLLPEFDGHSGYMERVEILGKKETRKILVERKLNVLRSWCNSVVDISELTPIKKEILAAIK